MLDLPLSFLHRPATPGSEPWLLVLMHGVGSNEQDLFGGEGLCREFIVGEQTAYAYAHVV